MPVIFRFNSYLALPSHGDGAGAGHIFNAIGPAGFDK